METISFSSVPLEGTLSFHVANRILQAIAEGELPPGAKLPPEQDLADSLGVGRNAVRDAVKILSSNGFVAIRRGEGTFVLDHSTPPLLCPLMFGLIWAEISPCELFDFSLASLHTHLHLILSPETKKELSPRKLSELLEKYDRFVDACTIPPTPEQMELFWALRVEWVVHTSQNDTLIKLFGSELMCLTMRQWDLLQLLTTEAQWSALFRLDRREREIVLSKDTVAIDGFTEEFRAFWHTTLKDLDVVPTYPEIAILGEEAATYSSFRRVYLNLAWDIMRGTYPPGSRLPTELELSRSMKVSRNTLREVLKCMEAIGVVTILRGDGMYVSPQQTSRLIIDDRVYGRILTPSDRASLDDLRTSVHRGAAYLKRYSDKPNAVLSQLDKVFTRILGEP